MNLSVFPLFSHREAPGRIARPVSASATVAIVSVLAGLLLVLRPSVALALDPDRLPSQYRDVGWSSEQGFHQGLVRALAQTPDGYLWIGTQQGLASFDGVRFRVYDGDNTDALRNNTVSDLTVDPAGRLWAPTLDGLTCRSANGRFTHLDVPGGAEAKTLACVHADPSGDLWVGTLEHGLRCWRDGDFVPLPGAVEEALAHETVWAIAGDRATGLWLGTNNGVFRLRGSEVKRFTAAEGLPSDRVRALLLDRGGRLWVGMRPGLARLDGERFVAVAADRLGEQGVVSLCEDRAGQLWLGTFNGGLWRLDPHTLAASAAPLYPNKRVQKVLEDREGSLWAGGTLGLRRLTDVRLAPFGPAEGLDNNRVRGVLESRSGRLWIGTENGLFWRENSRFAEQPFATADGKPAVGLGRYVTGLCEDRAGRLWFGTQDGLIRRLDPTGAVDILPPAPAARGEPKSGPGYVRGIREDAAGQLWFATNAGGVKCLGADGRWVPVEEGDAPAPPYVSALCVGHDGTVWTGTAEGLLRVRGHTVGPLPPEAAPPVPSAEVTCLHELNDGTLFVAYLDRGLCRLRDGRFSPLIASTKSGLPHNNVWRVFEHGSQIWFSGAAGVFALERRELDDFFDGRRATVSPVTYGMSDGLRTEGCNGGIDPAGWLGANGQLWLPADDLVNLDLSKLRGNPLPPPVSLEGVTVERTETHGPAALAVPAGLTLAPGQRNLEMDYTALSLAAPEKVRFRYRLEGYDLTWVDAGTRRTAFYTNLAPGRYRFRVAAANNDGVWNDTGATLALHLLPHFWQTRWFQVLAAAASLGVAGLAVWLLHLRRLAQVRAEYALVLAERTRIAREIHDTLAQGFAGVHSQLQAVDLVLPPDGQVPEVVRRHVGLARRMAQHSMREARQIIGHLRNDDPPRRVDLPAALAEVVAQVPPPPTGAPPGVTFAVEGAPRRLPDAVEHALVRIAQEALVNAARHAGATRVDVRLKYKPDETRLVVSDDGGGFDARGAFSTLDGHFGLLGMRERAAGLGGRLDLRSAPGAGTVVAVTLPTAGALATTNGPEAVDQ